jgi:uncharacterized protein (DUF2147 family)
MLVMRTLCIAATCVLLAAPAAHAGSIIDSFLGGGGGGGFSIGGCNTDQCSFSVGKQKHVVRRSDFESAAATGMEMGDKAMRAAKSQLKARAKASDTSVSERAAPSKQREQSVDRSDERPASRRDVTSTSAKDTPVKDTAAPAKDNPVTKDTVVTKDTFAKDTLDTFAKDTVVTKDSFAPVDARSSETTGAAPALAATETAPTYDPKSPIGEWITEDGEGRVRIRTCGQALCGVISSGDPTDTDRHNPDVNKRNRPLLGTPVLIDMKSVNSRRWEGEIYNAKNGKTYASNIMLKNPDVLRVEGCVFGGFFCGGQDWTRAKDSPKG